MFNVIRIWFVKVAQKTVELRPIFGRLLVFVGLHLGIFQMPQADITISLPMVERWVARWTIQRLFQLKESATDAEKFMIWPDGHKIDGPTKERMISAKKTDDELPTVAQRIPFLPQKPSSAGHFWKCDLGLNGIFRPSYLYNLNVFLYNYLY